VQAAHLAIAGAAYAAGTPWLIEVYDLARPEDEAYLRFGSDRAGMAAPIAVVVDGAALRVVGSGDLAAACV
jgi:hypothetical protein